jgi:hypothetical protein
VTTDRAGARACASCHEQPRHGWSWVDGKRICSRCYPTYIAELLAQRRIAPPPTGVKAPPLDRRPVPATEAIAEGWEPLVRPARAYLAARSKHPGRRRRVTPPTVVTASGPRVEVTPPVRSGWSCDECGVRFPSRVEPQRRDGGEFCRSCL